MLSRLSCSHSARHRYLFGASNISCVQCAISAFKAINEVETKSSIELTDAELYAAVQCLDSLPKLLELVLPFAAEPAILASLTRQMIGLCLSPLMFVCRGESIDRKLNKSLKISLEYLRKLPLEVLQSALSTEYEQCVRAAMMTLRCSNNLSQLSACVGILILLAGIRSFSVLCCAEENLWCLLLCHLLHTFHCRDEQELLVNLFLCLVVHIVPECDQILQTFPCHAKSVDKSPSSTGNFTWEVLLCVAEACILQLIHCQSGGAYSTQSFSAVRFCDDKIKAMLVLRAILQYYNGIYANQLSLEGSQINSAILFEPIRRISKIVCDNLDDVLCCLLSTAEAESESFKSSFYAVQYPGLYSISLGLVIVQLLLTLAHLAKNIDVSKYIGKYKIVEHDLCGNFMSHSDLFSRVVDLLTGSILNEKSVIYLEDFIAGSKVNNFYRACDSIFLEFMNAHLNHLNLDRLNVNYLVHTLARPCVNIQSACICILNILFSDTDSAMQAFHNSNFSPSLFSLFFLLMIQERLCVALPISEILSCLIKMTSKYDTEICRLSGDYFVALLLREEDKACCCGIKSEDALDMIDFLPPSQKINFCCCCSAETARTLVGGQVILLILQVIRKHHAYSITTNSASDKNELREKTEGLRLVVCDALKVLKIHSVGWNDAYPPEFLSFIDAIMKSFSFLCVLFSYFGPDFYHDALLRTREDYDCFATLLAVVGSSILTNSSACILFSSTVSLISSVIRLSLCEIKRSAQLQDDFLANFIFLDVGSSRSLHKSLFKCWIQCHKDSTQMLRNDTILHYSEILYFTLHESKKHVHANVTENREATIFTELMCELSSKLSSSKGVDSELILLWARNDKPTTNKFKRICFAKLYLYLLCCLDPMIALKSLDGSYLAEIIQDDSETDLSYALDLVSLHNLVPFIANNVALHSTGRDSLADNIFNVMKHYKRNILHFPAIILSVIFLKSANLDSLFYQSNIQELPCDADEHIELFAFDPVDASTFLRVLLAKSIDVIQLQTKLIKTELNKEINEDVSLTFMLNHVRVMSMVLSLVNPAVTALMRFRKIEHPGDVLNNLCAASFTIVEIMRMSKYSDCDTGYHSRSHINILDKLFAGILLVFMDYERLFIDVNYPMHAFLERSDNYIKFYALIWRLLQRSSMISPLDLDFARNWQILFQLLLQSLMTKVLVSPASQNIDIADDYVNCQVYLSLLEDHITWYVTQ